MKTSGLIWYRGKLSICSENILCSDKRVELSVLRPYYLGPIVRAEIDIKNCETTDIQFSVVGSANISGSGVNFGETTLYTLTMPVNCKVSRSSGAMWN